MDRENANGGEAQIDRNLAMEAVRVTEAAAIAANDHPGFNADTHDFYGAMAAGRVLWSHDRVH